MKYITYFLSIALVISYLYITYLKNKNNSLETKNIVLETNLNKANAQTKLFKGELYERNEKILALNREKSEIQKAINSDRSSVKWDLDISSTKPIVLLKRMHANRIR